MSRFNRGGVALKPENSLKRAEELIGVGQKGNALQTLHDTITNKRQQRNWTKALEEVMFRYMDLAVDMKQGRKCKDALINYRNTCQQVNVGSLEEVITYLLNVASERAEKARLEAQAQLEDVAADLEADASPEEMMLSYVSGEKSADRTDRELVTPWFKFLWETHRNVLDVVRNNSRLEALYASGAQRAFSFCLTYKRTTEFRRLCDILRNHLSNLIKYRDQTNQNRTDLALPATWELYVEMRFGQLRTACDLELWAEAFRSVEDIQGLLGMMPKGVKGPKPSLMAVYYARLTQIFTRSEARLYNAYAWYRLFLFSKSSNKGLTAEDVQALASNVVLSALSVLPYEQATAARSEEGRQIERERAVKMAGILGFSVDRRDGRALLSRSALLVDIERKGLLNLVSPQVRTIYSLLEGEFNPLTLCKAVAPVLEGLPALGASLAITPACPAGAAAAALDVYVPFLQQVALARTVRQLSEVYSVMRVSGLSDLAPFVSFGDVEQLVVDAVRHGYVQARFDHKNATVHFGGQDMHSDRVAGHLAALARRLSRSLTAMEAPGARAAIADAQRTALVRRALESAAAENDAALQRRGVIEKRKEEAERVMMEREREAEEVRARADAAAREQEEIRKQQERARRETEALQRELEEREQEELKAFLAARGRKVGEGEKLDAEVITKEAREEHNRAQHELHRKLAKLGKAMDHLERARREEEAPLILEASKQAAVQYKVLWEQEKAAAKVAARAQWERDLELKHATARVVVEAQAFAATVAARRAEEFAAIKAEKEAAAAAAKAQRAVERDIARKREYVRRCRMQIEEKRKEEEAAAKAEEEERKIRETAERQRKLDEIAEKQRQREAEIEAKARGERADGGAAPSAAPQAAAAAPAATKGAYVPAHLRRAGGGAPAAAAPAPRSDSRDRRADSREREPPARGAGGGAAWRPSRGREGRDDGGGGDSRSGDRGPPPARGGSRW